MSIYLLYFWTNTTCSFFLFVFCFEFGHQEIEPFSQGTLVNIGFGIEGVIESCGNLIPQFSSQRSPFWFKEDLIPLPLSKIMCHIDLSTPLCWKREPRFILGVYSRNGGDNSSSFPD